MRFSLQVGNHIDVQTGKWTALDAGIGAGVDSYFEYLVKGAALLQRPELLQQFYSKHLLQHHNLLSTFPVIGVCPNNPQAPLKKYASTVSYSCFWVALQHIVKRWRNT